MIEFTGLESAISGYTAQGVVIYDYEKIIEAFMEQNDWDRDEAAEWTSFNVESMHLGEFTPIISYPTNPLGEFDD